MPGWLAPRPLKWRPLWLAIGWILVVVVVAASLAPRLPDVDLPLVPVDKVGHLLAYLALMSWFGFIYLRPAHLRIAALLILMGVLLEGAQYAVGYRSFAAGDMAANLAGIAAGLLLARSRFAGLLTLLERRFEH